MNCDAVRRLLDLENVDLPLDRDALRAHLSSCRRCTLRWPEAVVLVAAPEPSARVAAAPAGGHRFAAFAAAVVLVVVARVVESGRTELGRDGTTPAGAVADDAAVVADAQPIAAPSAAPDHGDGRVRMLPASASRVERTLVRIENGRAVTSTVRHEGWSAPRAHGLR